MEIILASFAAMILYNAAGFLLAQRLYKRDTPLASRTVALGVAGLAIIFHSVSLFHNFLGIDGINFSLFNVLSLLGWLIACLLLMGSLYQPLENLGILAFPSAAIALGIDMVFPGQHLLTEKGNPALQIHILVSVLAYSMLSLAAAQAILLAIQEKHLRSRRPGGFIRALPPLQIMENLLFQLIGLGFILQSFSLISGALFIQDIFAQHLAHKTVFSVAAWLFFATLLIGHWRYGWRGRTAVRWTLGGATALMLAYVGVKTVLELVLHRT